MLTFVPTPLGNLQDITYRAIDVFASATLFLCEDTRVTKSLLHLLDERKLLPKFPEAEFLSFNEHNGAERLRGLGERLQNDEIVYVSDAGMPAISDPGQLLVAYCQEHRLDYDVLPGPSAATTVYAASGFPSGRFLFYGFLPRKGRERREALRELIDQPHDTILYEAPHRLERLLEELRDLIPERRLFAAKEISKQHQRFYTGSVGDLFAEIVGEGKIRGEWALVLEGAAGEHPCLGLRDILDASLPPKAKAKLLARLSGEESSVWYRRLTQGASGKKG
ncbi:16S rRNA (cytidine(1402)-2'-O)-methyltransferase [Nitratifractor sp.]|uniref:16S rRNA (cytidine(1402)-2'-O)-methyltransferase n=1 Tax=Nitratifractor sp. TaxID=2268144 RepID=UPI0025DC0C7C|nr:16S rRNA (cytidine(1402)-2'-O)-methyltransferase [Nitratifractor sp.]